MSAFAELGRFLVPLGSKPALRYFNDALYVPHGLAGRIRRTIGRPPFRRTTSIEGAEHLFELHGGDPHEFIILRDYESSRRGRVVAFAFPGASTTPAAVVKAQHATTGSTSLRKEGEALERLVAILPPLLGATVPRVLRIETSARGEILVTTALPGRSAYVDMQGSLVPWRYAGPHFRGAARWLASFHDATASARTDEIGGIAVRRTAVHGDFWLRNVLIDAAGGIGVVDWEHFVSDGSPFVDLFHYALTYGVSYPFRLYRPADAELAFARTFLERSRVSRAVRAYLLAYLRMRRLPPEVLAPAFRRFVATSGTMRDGAPPHPGVATLPWGRFATMLDRSTPFALTP